MSSLCQSLHTFYLCKNILNKIGMVIIPASVVITAAAAAKVGDPPNRRVKIAALTLTIITATMIDTIRY